METVWLTPNGELLVIKHMRFEFETANEVTQRVIENLINKLVMVFEYRLEYLGYL